MASRSQSFTTRQHMIRRTYEVYRYRDCYLNEVALHHHDFYEVYFFLSGNIAYTIDSRVYQMIPGDILLISPNELHQPLFGKAMQPYERMVLWIDKNYLQRFSVWDVDLARCFDQGTSNLLRPDAQLRTTLTTLFEQMLLEDGKQAFAGELLSDTLFLQTMILINRLAMQPSGVPELPDKSGSVVEDVLAYINEHYQEELSLDLLANEFFISKYHLSREFNRLVGTSVYRYIIQKRLVVAKHLLSDGVPSTTVYQQCGFGDYSNFYRAFKAEYAISPKEYITKLREESAQLEEQTREKGWYGGEFSQRTQS